MNLGAYDGTSDYAGPSGTVVALAGTATNQIVYTPGSAELAQFTGTGTVDLTTLGLVSSSESGDANLRSLFLSTTTAVVSLQYDYIAPGSSSGGGGGGGGAGAGTILVLGPTIYPFLPGSTTVAQSFTLADATTGWNQHLSVVPFDASLGTLQAVEFTVSADLKATAQVENLGSGTIGVSGTLAAPVTLTAGTIATTITPLVTVNAGFSPILLGTYDGTTDFGGTSGTTIGGLSSTLSNTFELSDPATVALFTGADAVDVPIVTSGTSVFDGSGNMLTNLSEMAGATVSIQYIYTAPSASSVVCFLRGTYIATPNGEVPIEDLRPGQNILTASGRTAPIVWIGTGKVLATRGRRSPATPIIVQRGALGDKVPHRDLHVTKAHAFHIDGVLIPVEFLVNHRSIRWDDRAQEVAIYHVELDRHDILLANGAPAESYRNDGNRWLFQNANTGWGLPPQPPCAPVKTGGPTVDDAWWRLLRRAGRRLAPLLTDDPDLHLIADGRPLRSARQIGSAYLFALPKAPSTLRIVSRSGAPQELGLARDPRELGVAMRRIAVRQAARFRTMEASDLALTEGFHTFEADAGIRWTNGDAIVPPALFGGFSGPVEFLLTIAAHARYLDRGIKLHHA